MAGGLPEPILISELVHLDHITIAGQTVEFRHVFYTWMAMLILFVVGWLVRRNISLIPGKMQNIFESIIGGLEDFTVTNMGEDGRKVFPVLGGLFLFIAVQNILGLIPACDAPTAMQPTQENIIQLMLFRIFCASYRAFFSSGSVL